MICSTLAEPLHKVDQLTFLNRAHPRLPADRNVRVDVPVGPGT